MTVEQARAIRLHCSARCRKTEKKQAEIKAITGPSINFATDFLAGEPQEGVTIATRCQAEYNPKKKAWHLVVVNRCHGGAFDNLFKRNTVARTENIFDALHWCSSFQASAEGDLGKRIIAPGEDYSYGFDHWRDVAKNMKLPVAKSGVLLLPEEGRILPDGYYNGEQIAAHKTPHLSAVSTASPPVSNTIESISLYREAMARGAALEDALGVMGENGYLSVGPADDELILHIVGDIIGFSISVVPAFIYESFLLMVAGFLLPSVLAETMRYATGSPTVFPMRCFEKHCAAFNKAAARLPDPNDRALCQEFAKQAAFTFWSGRAQTILKAGFSAKAGLACLDKAMAAIGLEGDKRENLRNRYMAAGLERRSSSRLQAAGQSVVSWDSVEKRLQNAALKLGGGA